MTAFLFPILIACSAHQAPQVSMGSAVDIHGDTELSSADALASAELRVDEHIRSLWEERAKRTALRQSPVWMPQMLTDNVIRRWLVDLPVQRLVKQVNRDEKERVHEFGNSFQTTLWIVEDQEMVRTGRLRLRAELDRLALSTVAKAGGVAVVWAFLALLLSWLDRLSRGYMTGRLRAVGALGGLLMPIALFLV